MRKAQFLLRTLHDNFHRFGCRPVRPEPISNRFFAKFVYGINCVGCRVIGNRRQSLRICRAATLHHSASDRISKRAEELAESLGSRRVH